MAGRVELASAGCHAGRVPAVARIAGFLSITLFCLAGFASGNAARALVVESGETVEVIFVFGSPPTVGSEPIDFLALTTTHFSVSGPGIAVSTQLFDGSTLLGSGVRPSAALISFSDGLFSNAIPASLDTLTGPGFQGRMRFTPIFPNDSAFIDFEPNNFNVRTGHGFESSVLLADPGADILSVTIAATPAPTALLLFASALAVLGVTLCRRRPWAQGRRAA